MQDPKQFDFFEDDDDSDDDEDHSFNKVHLIHQGWKATLTLKDLMLQRSSSKRRADARSKELSEEEKKQLRQASRKLHRCGRANVTILLSVELTVSRTLGPCAICEAWRDIETGRSSTFSLLNMR